MKKALLFLPIALVAADLEQPWLGNPYELVADGSWEIAHYAGIGSVNYTSWDHLAMARLSASLEEWQFALAAYTAATTANTFKPVGLSALGRYQLLNDVNGCDPMSLTVALRLDEASKWGLKDPSLNYFGYTQAEAQISLGKEWACGCFWDWRLWGLVAFGAPTQGSSWWRLQATLAKNMSDNMSLSASIERLVGLGRNSFPGIEGFLYGWGPIATERTDLKMAWTASIYTVGEIGVQWTIRLAARQAPNNRQAAALTLTIPFGI